MSKYLTLVSGIPESATVEGTDIGSSNATATQFLAADGSGDSAFRAIAVGDLPSVASILTLLGIYSGKASLSSGATSVSVTFSTPYSGVNYSVQANFLNTTDTNPQFQPITITAQSDTGFTASWNDGTLTANYVLSWQATTDN